MATAAYLGKSTPEQGYWWGRRGRDGYLVYNLTGDYSSLPPYCSGVSTTWSGTGGTARLGATAFTNPSALRLAPPADQSTGLYTGKHGTVYTTTAVALTDSVPHVVSIYAVDPDALGRRMGMSILDASDAVICPAVPSGDFVAGAYFSWAVTGAVKIRLVQTAGFNAVHLGVFFDPHVSSTAGGVPPIAVGSFAG